MQESPKVRVESDGTPYGTRVTVDGKTLGNVTAMNLSLKAGESAGRLTLELFDVEVCVNNPQREAAKEQ